MIALIRYREFVSSSKMSLVGPWRCPLGKSGERRRRTGFGWQSRDHQVHGPSTQTRVPTRDDPYNALRTDLSVREKPQRDRTMSLVGH
jgi:hypothetical protein